jgi:hypothetical protein
LRGTGLREAGSSHPRLVPERKNLLKRQTTRGCRDDQHLHKFLPLLGIDG